MTVLDKYHRWGSYHFKWYYGGKESYVNHVNKVKDWIQEQIVLDVGSGEGLITSLLGEEAKGVDSNSRAVRLAERRGVNVVPGDAYDLDYEDEEFDAVFMGDVLEHFEFPEKAVTECRRVLKKYLYLAVPRKERWKDPLGQWYDWTPEELKVFVEKQGFVLEGEIEEANRKMYGKFRKVGT
jgi:ubiquinone/menaquinone biosynthesis C-methylase UbiE